MKHRMEDVGKTRSGLCRVQLRRKGQEVASPWRDEEFYRLGEANWANSKKRWVSYGLAFRHQLLAMLTKLDFVQIEPRGFQMSGICSSHGLVLGGKVA